MTRLIAMDNFPLYAVLIIDHGNEWIETDWTQDEDKAEEWAEELRDELGYQQAIVVQWDTPSEIEVEDSTDEED